MNKSELIDAIASGANLSKADAARALNATTGAITSAMASGDGVQLTGFGSFVVELVLLAVVVTHKQVLRFKLKLQMWLHLKQVRH